MNPDHQTTNVKHMHPHSQNSMKTNENLPPEDNLEAQQPAPCGLHGAACCASCFWWAGMTLMAASLPLFVLMGCFGQVMTVAGVACLCIGATIAIISDSIMLKRLEESIQHLSPEDKRSVWIRAVW